MRQRRLILATAVLSTLVISACASGGSGPATSKQGNTGAASSDITVGLLAPFSGDYAIYGEGYQAGIDAWIKANGQPKVGAHNVKIEQLDSKCDVATGVAAFRRAATKLTAVVGPSCSSVVPPLKPLIAQNKVPMLELAHAASNTLGYTGGWIFHISQPDTANQWAFGQYILAKWKSAGISKVGVIYDTSVTDAQAAKSWTAVSKKVGVTMAATAPFDPGTTDFTSQLLKLKSAGAQAYILQVFGPDESRIVQQMGTLKLDVPIASAEDTPYPFVLNKNTGPLQNNISYYTDYAPGTDLPELKKFEAAYSKVSQDSPLDIEWEGWLSMDVLMQALNRPGASTGGDALRKALTQTSVSLGGGDTVTFLKNGDQANVLTYAAKVENGKGILDKLIVTPRDSFPDWSSNG